MEIEIFRAPEEGGPETGQSYGGAGVSSVCAAGTIGEPEKSLGLSLVGGYVLLATHPAAVSYKTCWVPAFGRST
jgi:hypothetical protein